MKRVILISILSLFYLVNSVFSGNIIREERDFNSAVNIYNSGDYNASAYAFKSFLDTYKRSTWVDDSLYWAGQSYLKLKDYPEAVLYYKKIITEHANSKFYHKALFKIGESKFLQNNFSDALFYFKKFLTETDQKKENELYSSSLARCAQCNYNIKNYKNTISNTLKLFKLDNTLKEQPVYNYILAKSYFFTGSLDAAVKIFKKLSNDKKKPVEYKKNSAYYLGEIYFKKEDYNKSEKFYNQSLTYADSAVDGYTLNGLAWSQLKQKKYNESIKTFLKIFNSKEPELKRDVYYTIGNIYFKNKNFQLSQDYFQKSLTQYPKYKTKTVFDLLVKSSYKTKDFENITNLYDKFNFKLNSELEFIIGYSFLNLKKYNKAIEHFNNISFSNNPYFIDSKYYSGISYFHLQKYLSAIAELKLGLSGENLTESLKYLIQKKLAECYYSFNKYDQAIKYYLILLDSKITNNDRDNILYHLANSYYKLKQVPEGLSIFNLLFTDFPNSEYTYKGKFILARFYQNQKEFKKSEGFYKDIIKDSHKNNKVIPDAAFYLASLEFENNNFVEAENLFDLIITNFPDSPYYKDALYKSGFIKFKLNKFEKSNKYFLKLKQLSEISKPLINYYIGMNYYSLENFSRTIELFNKLLEDKNDKEGIAYDKVYLYLGLSYYFQKEYLKTVDIFSTLKNLYPESSNIPEILYVTAEIKYLNGNFEEAKKTIYKLKLTETKTKWLYLSYLLSAKINLETQEYKQAIENSNKFRSFNITKEKLQESYLLTGQAYFKLNDFDNAIKYFDSAETGPVKSFVEHSKYMIGKSYYNLKEYEKALEYYNVLLTTHKEYNDIEKVYFNAGLCLFKLNKMNETIKHYNYFVQNYSNSKFKEKSIYWTAKSYFSLQDYSNAIKEYMKIYNTKDPVLLETVVYEIGISYFNQKKYNDAIKYFNIFRNKFPDSENRPAAIHWIGLSSLKLGKISEFEKNLKEIIDQYPGRSVAAEAVYNLAKFYYDDEHYDSAVQYFNIIVAKYPEHNTIEKVKFFKGISLFRLKKYEKVTELFTDFINEHPEDLSQYIDQVYLILGESYNSLKQFDTALIYYNKVKNMELKENALYQAILIYFNNSNFDSVILTVNNFLNLYPNNVKTNYLKYLKAISFNKLKNNQKAISLFNEIIKNNPEQDIKKDIYTRLAGIYYNLKDYKKSTEWFNKLYTEFNFDNNLFYLHTGNSYFHSKQFKKAIEFFNNYLNKSKKLNNEQKTDVLLKISLCAKNLRLFDKVIDINKQLIELNYKTPDIYFDLIEAYIRTQDIKTAEEFLNKNDKIFKSQELTKLYNQIIDFYKNQNNNKKVILYLEKILDTTYNSDKPEYFKNKIRLADFYFDTKNFQEALVQYLDVLINFQPKSEKLHYKIIICYVNLKNTNQSKYYYKKLLKLNPVSPFIKDLQKYNLE